MGFDIDAVISHMTESEKCKLLAGADGWHTTGCARLGVPAVMMADGPHGLRKQSSGVDILGFNDSVSVTCFPTASATACSFDEDLLERIGQALGEECRAEGVSMLLGPGVNMKRSPLCGRNFEYFSEDPFLAGKLAAAHIRGVQSRGVGTSLKHFAGNSQEKARMTSDSVIDDRALHEIYLRAFRIAVQEGRPWSVMTAYNRLNGTYCSENRLLMQNILRDEWGFDGMTVTDWEALSSVTESLPAGLDLVMPGPRPDYAEALEWGVDHHSITRIELDAAVRRVLEFTDRCIQGQKALYSCDANEHLELAREAARRSAVLLENDGTLPVPPAASVAVIGSFAKTPRYQGAGSSKINPRELDCFWDAFCDQHAGMKTYAAGYDAATGLASEEQLRDAEEAARRCDVAIVFAGLPDSYESEGFDRRSMRMPNSHVHLIERVCAANPHTVVVLQGGAPIELPWRNLPAAILLMYLSGCQGGKASSDLITGAANPSGRLAETWPIQRGDTPTDGRFPDQAPEVLYAESIYVGYRYYDAVGAQVAYPFGYGLSYTTYRMSDLDVRTDSKGPAGALRVSCIVHNDGDYDGVQVVQLYVAPHDPKVFKAPQTLQAFACVDVPAHEARPVELHIDKRSFAHYDARRQHWCVETGTYELRIGSSSRDIALRETVQVEGDGCCDDGAPERYHHPTAGCFAPAEADAKDDFKELYGRPLPSPRPLRPFTINSTLSDTRHTIFGKVLGPFVIRRMVEAVGDERLYQAYAEMMEDMPIKTMHMQGWRMSSADVVVDVLNRRYLKGFFTWKRAQNAKELAAQSGVVLPEPQPNHIKSVSELLGLGVSQPDGRKNRKGGGKQRKSGKR